jgi:catechol 2,3-dioxygenase-like lactoylglutathione lyase family enzyme
MDSSVRFYRDALGLTPTEVSEWWTEFRAGGVSLALHPGQAAGAQGPRQGTDAGTAHITFTVADLERACEELRAAGVEVDGPRDLEGMAARIATFSDPDGLSLGLEGP